MRRGPAADGVHLQAPGPRTVQPHPDIPAEVVADLIRQVAATAWFATVPHPVKPAGWDIRWGAQVDPRVVRLTDDGEVADVAVASYLAKYATKSTEPAGMLPGRDVPPVLRTRRGGSLPSIYRDRTARSAFADP